MTHTRVGKSASLPRPGRPLPPAQSETLWVWAVCASLVVGMAIVYGQTLGFGLLDYDDNLFVYQCPQVRAGVTWEGIQWAFREGPQGEWYPVAMLSHMLDCQLYGANPANAWGHHLTSVAVHAATAIGLFLVLRSMTGELWPSALVAAIFALHPQQVESVAWVSERRDVLSGLFFVLALAAYLGHVRAPASSAQRRSRSLWWYLLVAAMLTLSLMSKPTAVTFPCVLLLLDFWPLGRFGQAARRVPSIALPFDAAHGRQTHQSGNGGHLVGPGAPHRSCPLAAPVGCSSRSCRYC